MGNERGLIRRLPSFGRRRAQATGQQGVLDLAVIHSELRRARRFRIPLAVTTFTFDAVPEQHSLPEIASSLQTELREFDYLVVDIERGMLSLWMFGTPREGAQTKLARMQAVPEIAAWIATSIVGVAVFPIDGMTCDALIDHALGQTPTLGSRLEPAADGRVAWQPSVRGANSRSTS